MNEEVLLAYIPVLHEGYRRFIEAHGSGRRLFLVGPELHLEYGPLAKDIRALAPEQAASAVASWGICAEVRVLDAAGAERLAREIRLMTRHGLGPRTGSRSMWEC